MQPQVVKEEVGVLGEPERLGQMEKVLSTGRQRISRNIRGRETEKGHEVINRETGSREAEGHRRTERDTQMLPAKRNQEVS